MISQEQIRQYRQDGATHLRAVIAPEWVERLPARVGTGDVFEHLVEVGLEVVAYFREIMPMAMLAGSAPEDSGFHARLAASNSPKVRAERKMEAFFEAEARAGRLSAAYRRAARCAD
jgi:hypothetical protein